MTEPLSLSPAAGITTTALHGGSGGGGVGMGDDTTMGNSADGDQQQPLRHSLQQHQQPPKPVLYTGTLPSSCLPHHHGQQQYRQRRFTTTIVVDAVENHHHHHHHHPAHQPPVVELQQQQQSVLEQHKQPQQDLLVHTPPKIVVPVDYTSLSCGLLAGIAQAGLLNPYDRALFLSVTHHRPFLALENWQAPYTGFLQSMTGRALQGGLYFPLEQFFLSVMTPSSSNDTAKNATGDSSSGGGLVHFMAGTAAGAVNALILNPLSALKYKTWGGQAVSSSSSSSSSSPSSSPSAQSRGSGSMRRVQRRLQIRDVTTAVAATNETRRRRVLLWSTTIRPLWNGLAPTLYRDVVFGGCYTSLRWQIRDYLLQSSSSSSSHSTTTAATATWQANLIAAASATILSGPFNYARNIQYATPSHERPLSTYTILHNLLQETTRQQHHHPVRFLQNRLQLGWGTARVAFGISLGHGIYDWLLQQAQQQQPTAPVARLLENHQYHSAAHVLEQQQQQELYALSTSA